MNEKYLDKIKYEKIGEKSYEVVEKEIKQYYENADIVIFQRALKKITNI